jgi:hypothetical protein
VRLTKWWSKGEACLAGEFCGACSPGLKSRRHT